jgi:soluble lytic murein transglycosylase-like protein
VRKRAVLTFVTSVVLVSSVAPTVSAGTIWSRERGGGVIEFTNKTPKDGTGKWKVWLKTGPGKASALRGSTDLVPARDTSSARFSRYDQDIRDQQSIYGIPEALMRAIIKTESDFDPAVVSSAGAQGLMQLMPDTARLMGVTDPFDPRQSIMGGARYLQVLARRFCKQVTSAGTVCAPDEKVKIVAAYNAGPGAVEKYGGIPPYETTHFYVAAVMRRYDELAGKAPDAAPPRGAPR